MAKYANRLLCSIKTENYRVFTRGTPNYVLTTVLGRRVSLRLSLTVMVDLALEALHAARSVPEGEEDGQSSPLSKIVKTQGLP